MATCRGSASPIDEGPRDTETAIPFTLIDMGCADGGTSIDLVRQATAAVRARWSRRSIWVVYADQLRNDYNSLFNLVHGLTPIPTYLDETEDVHVLASASGFYRPIVPAGTLDLGFSATAMHWLAASLATSPTTSRPLVLRGLSLRPSPSRVGVIGKLYSYGARKRWHQGRGWCWSIFVRMKPAGIWATPTV
jgi:hypothetical protein